MTQVYLHLNLNILLVHRTKLLLARSKFVKCKLLTCKVIILILLCHQTTISTADKPTVRETLFFNH